MSPIDPQAGANSYLRTKILTASAQELRLMLYEGAIKFCRQARQAMAGNDAEAGFNNLMRAQKIVLELSTSLNHAAAPELCQRLSALYTFIYRRLVEATVQRDVKAVDEAVQLLEYEKETWQMLMKRSGQEGGIPPSSNAPPVPGAQQTAISSLSVNG